MTNQNQITSKTDRDGRKFTISYGAEFPSPRSTPIARPSMPSNSSILGYRSEPTEPKRSARLYPLHHNGNRRSWSIPGNTQYDSNGFPLTITAPDCATTTYTYDPATLRVASMTDANGHTSSFQYDSEGNLIQSTDANNNVTQFTYEPDFNQMTSMTDPNGRTTSYTYDGNGNRDQRDRSARHTASMTYDSHGNVLTATDKRGNTTTYVYDCFGNRIKATDALSEVTK